VTRVRALPVDAMGGVEVPVVDAMGGVRVHG